MSPLPSLSSLPDAPLIFRIAGWPIETLEDLRCPRFAASVDAFIAEAAEIRAASEDCGDATDLRGWAESVGGALVVTRGDPDLFDPWGTPPPALDLQRRLIAQFDPSRIINPGRLPGGL